MADLKRASLSLDLMPAGATAPPSEFRVFSAGHVETTKGIFLFDEEAAQSVMARQAEYGNELPIDFNHGMAEGWPMDPGLAGRAAGWFTPEVRNGELWAVKVSWTKEAAAQVADRQWRYMSPWFSHEDGGRIRELFNVALTNTPATKRLTPLVASRAGDNPPQETPPMLPKFVAALSLKPEATEAEVLSAVSYHKEMASSLLSLTGKATASEALGVVQGWKTTAEQLPALQTELSGLRASVTKAEVEQVLLANAKKVSPAMRAEWEKLGLLDDPSRFKAMLSVMPELMPTAAKPPEGGKDTETLSDEDARAANSLGIDPKAFAEHKRAQAKR